MCLWQFPVFQEISCIAGKTNYLALFQCCANDQLADLQQQNVGKRLAAYEYKRKKLWVKHCFTYDLTLEEDMVVYHGGYVA